MLEPLEHLLWNSFHSGQAYHFPENCLSRGISCPLSTCVRGILNAFVCIHDTEMMFYDRYSYTWFSVQ